MIVLLSIVSGDLRELGSEYCLYMREPRFEPGDFFGRFRATREVDRVMEILLALLKQATAAPGLGASYIASWAVSANASNARMSSKSSSLLEASTHWRAVRRRRPRRTGGRLVKPKRYSRGNRPLVGQISNAPLVSATRLLCRHKSDGTKSHGGCH